MPPSRSQYRLHLAEKHQETITQSAMSGETMMAVLKTAAVSYDHLTQSDEWNRFLSKVAGELEDRKKEREALLLLCGGAVGDASEQARLGYQYAKGYVDALEKMSTFPHQVMDMYQEVKKDNNGRDGA